MNNSQTPIARKEGLVIQEMPDEALVYDMANNKAHCLNKTAAFVWKKCDGKNSVADIKNLLAAETNNPVQEDFIWLAIDQLNDKNLLEEKMSAPFAGESRRNVIKKIGLAAVIALPVVTSLVAPAPAHAGSSCVGPACGGANPPCASGCACNNPAGGTCV